MHYNEQSQVIVQLIAWLVQGCSSYCSNTVTVTVILIAVGKGDGPTPMCTVLYVGRENSRWILSESRGYLVARAECRQD